jgi:hypothetical protein
MPMCDSVPVAGLQLSAPHAVDAVGKLHFAPSYPSQREPHVVPSPTPPHAALPPVGTPATGEQVPTLPVTLHALHCWVHAELQHTPSAHWPLAHSVAAAQVTPSGLLQTPSFPG